MILVTGYNTTVIRALSGMVDEPVVRIDADWRILDCTFAMPSPITKVVLCAGVLVGKAALDQSAVEIHDTFAVNLVSPIRICEAVLSAAPDANIVIVGSESGIAGSFDRYYAASKAAIHHYVSSRQVCGQQRLNAVAPPIISDSGMTSRRHDYPDCLGNRKHVPAHAVAELILNVLSLPNTNRIYQMGSK